MHFSLAVAPAASTDNGGQGYRQRRLYVVRAGFAASVDLFYASKACCCAQPVGAPPPTALECMLQPRQQPPLPRLSAAAARPVAHRPLPLPHVAAYSLPSCCFAVSAGGIIVSEEAPEEPATTAASGDPSAGFQNPWNTYGTWWGRCATQSGSACAEATGHHHQSLEDARQRRAAGPPISLLCDAALPIPPPANHAPRYPSHPGPRSRSCGCPDRIRRAADTCVKFAPVPWCGEQQQQEEQASRAA